MGDYLAACVTLWGALAILRTRRDFRVTGWAERRRLETADFGMLVFLATIIAVAGASIAIGPDVMNAVISASRDVALSAARVIRPETNLSFLEWNEGNRHNIWIASTAIASLSCGLIPFLSPPNSLVRPIGALVLCTGLVGATLAVPWPDAYGGHEPGGAVIVWYSPVAGLVVWHCFVFFASGFKSRRNAAWLREAWRPAGALGLCSMALVISSNYLPLRDLATRRIVCLDTTTGDEVWHTDVLTTHLEPKSAFNSHATPTPVVFKDMIVAAFGPGIAAVNRDGQLIWSRMFPEWVSNTIYGAASSPVTDGQAYS
jgi:hypothetical protein